jgi:hypothetical protein
MNPATARGPMGLDRRQLGRLAAKAVPNLVVAGVMPAVLFLVGRSLWGLGGAILLAAGWNASCQALRRLRGQPLSGLLILGLVSLVVRASVALAMHSAQLYYLAPAVVTALTGAVFIGSAFTSLPLAARVLSELVPETVLDPSDPRVHRLLRRGSMWYGAEQIGVSAVSTWMVLHLSTTTYVTVHPTVSWSVFGLCALLVWPWLRGDLAGLRARAGLRLDSCTVGFGAGFDPVIPMDERDGHEVEWESSLATANVCPAFI